MLGLVPLLFAAALPLAERNPGPLLLKADRIYTGSARETEALKGAAVYVRDGRVVRVIAAGEPLPPDAAVIDYGSAVIIPGLVCAGGSAMPDALGVETGGAEYRAADAFDPYAANLRLMEAGVTTIYLEPGRHRLISGVGAVVKTQGNTTREQRVLLESADLRLNVGLEGLAPPDSIVPPLPP